MPERERMSTREWLDPPGPLRSYRRLVGVLAVLGVPATAAVGVGVAPADGRTLFLAGMLAVGVLGVSYLVIWAIDLIAIYTDPEESPWR